MLNPSTPLIATLIALPVLFAQQNNSTQSPANSNNATSTPPAGSAAPTDTTATSSATFTPTTFTPTLATNTTCGSAQQNFNQCITKVGKDISSCTNNVCLCQTYANIAACYNGCNELAEQGKQYQSQSTQYCTVAHVKPNTTVDAPPPMTTSTSASPNSTSSTGSNSSPTTGSNASTFSAAKGNQASGITLSPWHAISGLIATLTILLL